MTKQTNKALLVPVWGSMLFAALYVAAGFYYPGGNPFDSSAKAFSWAKNYWCNLLDHQAMNGAPNEAQPVAITAMVVLCGTLVLFWHQFAAHAPLSQRVRRLLRYAGILSMASLFFLLTGDHDVVLNIASAFGLIAVCVTLQGLRKLRWTGLLRLGAFDVLLVGVNNLLYYNKSLQGYLPVVQKITFFFFLLWVCLVSVRLFRSVRLQPSS